jgi:hypothetical protein
MRPSADAAEFGASHARPMPTKIDFKRELRELYLPRRQPVLVEVPELAFVMIDGRGDPSCAASYREAIEALYAVAYAAKFAVKRGASAIDFAVMPVESLWWTEGQAVFAQTSKSDWNWTAMIMQPEPVTAQIVTDAREQAAAKRSLPALDLLRYEHFVEGRTAQVLYVGPYRDEGPTIEALHAFIARQGLRPLGRHHEIYLSDPRRSAPAKLTTVLRQPVADDRGPDAG